MVQQQYNFEQIFKQNYTLDHVKRQSAQWFIDQMKDVAAPYHKATNVMQMKQLENKTGLSTTMEPGNMYLYGYDPKWKNTPVLPYWDAFPIGFPWRTWTEKGVTYFIMCNFHYLPPKARIQMLNYMMKYVNTKSFFLRRPTIKENTALNYNWQIMKSASEYPFAAASVKRYILKQVKTPFKKIHPKFWVEALMLPIEQYKGTKDKYGAWLDSAARAVEYTKRHTVKKAVLKPSQANPIRKTGRP